MAGLREEQPGALELLTDVLHERLGVLETRMGCPLAVSGAGDEGHRRFAGCAHASQLRRARASPT